MKLSQITSWLDTTLNVAAFDDVSNNGLQIAHTGEEVLTVAFAVDASVRAARAAAEAGAQLLVVHHGISWGGGIRRLTGGVYDVVRAALEANLAVYACHLPLDAHPTLGNNAQLARWLGLRAIRPAFSYHGNVIGFVGCGRRSVVSERVGGEVAAETEEILVGVCSGGAGEFAEEAKRLGCDVFVTGEANWGEVIAAENCGMKMVTLGHYETEVWGVRAVAGEMARALGVATRDLTEELGRKRA